MYKLFFAATLLFASFNAYAEVQGKEIVYRVDGVEFTGYLAFDDAVKGRRPGILILHEWWGHNAYARKRADLLAALGYTAFALDMYGTGKQADHPEDAKRFNMPLAYDKAADEDSWQQMTEFFHRIFK